MKKLSILSLILCFSLVWAAPGVQSRKASNTSDLHDYIRHSYHQGSDRPLDATRLMTTAVVDTYLLAEFNFETYSSADPQGWFGVDKTSQGTFFHVDDFAGLGGGSFNLLHPLRGSQSMWCGARPDPGSTTLCNYNHLPGYGNSWDQRFESVDIPISGDVTIGFEAQYDTEDGYDFGYLEYKNKDDEWVEIAALTGTGSQYVQEMVPATELSGSIKYRIHFISDGAWSDEDVLNSDGALIIDSLIVFDGSGTLDFQDFESESVGDTVTSDGDWAAVPRPAYGNYAGLVSGSTVLQQDPCERNVSYLWAFFVGSTETYACGGHPEQAAIPYAKEIDGETLYLSNEIWSPPFSWTHDIHGTPVPSSAVAANFEFDVYGDNPTDPLIYLNHAIRSWQSGCPGYWKDRAFVSYLPGPAWYHQVHPFGDLVQPGADQVQLMLGAYDMCYLWCGGMGSGNCHRQAPLYDKVRFYRLSFNGPQWSVRDIDLFQDTFPENGTAYGTGRVDAAIDRAPHSSPTIYPGDSVAVTCADPVNGLLEPDPTTGFGPAVYCYAAIMPQGQPGKDGPALEGDGLRWPLVDSVMIAGLNWYRFRMDTVFTESGGPRTVAAPDKFCIDFNDNLIENGDTLLFFFGAENSIAEQTFWSQDAGATDSRDEAAAWPMEMQVLPGVGGTFYSYDILYVDNFDGGGAQPYFDSALEMITLLDNADRFDKRGPSSCVGNGLGAKVTSVFNQLIPVYRYIIWNSGDLSTGTVGDGTGDPEKSNDWTLLFTFLDQHTDASGAAIYFSGDDLAEEWAELGGSYALMFKQIYLPHSLVSGDQAPLHGISPLVMGENGGIFDYGVPLEEDTMVAYGGCPGINDFDVIRPLGSSNLEMSYGGTGLAADGAVISFDSTNALGNPARVVLSGFSFHCIRDDRPAGVPDRADHLADITRFCSGITPDPVDVGDTPIYQWSLSQNYPNPFNPVTTISYSIKQRSRVTLKIFNVAGQLVRTLVNEEQAPRAEGFTVTWRGKSDSGQTVSSGVYFYRLRAGDYTSIKKMVFLK